MFSGNNSCRDTAAAIGKVHVYENVLLENFHTLYHCAVINCINLPVNILHSKNN